MWLYEPAAREWGRNCFFLPLQSKQVRAYENNASFFVVVFFLFILEKIHKNINKLMMRLCIASGWADAKKLLATPQNTCLEFIDYLLISQTVRNPLWGCRVHYLQIYMSFYKSIFFLKGEAAQYLTSTSINNSMALRGKLRNN